MTDVGQETPQTRNGRVETSHHPRTDPGREAQDYYGIPPIKEHTWTWEVPVYFWLGGIGAGSQLISTVAQLLGWKDGALFRATRYTVLVTMIDRKSTRLNSSHANISYAVFCLKKKKT